MPEDTKVQNYQTVPKSTLDTSAVFNYLPHLTMRMARQRRKANPSANRRQTPDELRKSLADQSPQTDFSRTYQKSELSTLVTDATNLAKNPRVPGALQNTLSTSAQQLQTVLQKNINSETIQGTPEIDRLISDIQKNLDYATQYSNSPYEDKKNKSDYKSRIENANSVTESNAIYDEFFKTELPEIPIDKLNGLGVTFKSDLLTLGFEEAFNAIISFLKIYFSTDSSTMNFTEYVKFHNLYASGTLDDSLLRGETLVGTSSVIFSNYFYKKSQAEIEWLAETENKLSDPRTVQEKITNTSIVDHYKLPSVPGIKQFLIALFYESSDMGKFKFSGSTSAQPIKEPITIANTLKFCGVKDYTVQRQGKENWKTVLNSLKITKTNVQQAMTAIVTEYVLSDVTYEKLMTKYKLSDVSMTIKEFHDWRQALHKANITEDNCADVLEYLNTTYNK